MARSTKSGFSLRCSTVVIRQESAPTISNFSFLQSSDIFTSQYTWRRMHIRTFISYNTGTPRRLRHEQRQPQDLSCLPHKRPCHVYKSCKFLWTGTYIDTLIRTVHFSTQFSEISGKVWADSSSFQICRFLQGSLPFSWLHAPERFAGRYSIYPLRHFV